MISGQRISGEEVSCCLLEHVLTFCCSLLVWQSVTRDSRRPPYQVSGTVGRAVREWSHRTPNQGEQKREDRVRRLVRVQVKEAEALESR